MISSFDLSTASHYSAVTLITILLIAGILIYRRSTEKSGLNKLFTAAAPLCAALLLLIIIMNILRQPFSPWVHNRLTVPIAFAHGLHCFNPSGSGPILSWMYGPLAMIAYVPAALAASPMLAVIFGSVLSVIFYSTPLFMAAIEGAAGSPLRRKIPAIIAALFAAILISTKNVVLAAPFYGITADAPAFCFAGIACALLVDKKNHGQIRPLVIAAVLTVFAIFTKQNMLPFIVILPVFIGFTGGHKSFLLFSSAIAATIIVTTIFSVWLCGSFADLWSMLSLPFQYPWIAITPGTYTEAPFITGSSLFLRTKAIVAAGVEFGIFALPLLLLIGLCVTPRRPHLWNPAIDKISTRPGDHRSLLPILVAIGTLPVALISRVKLGGYFSSHAVALYFLLMTATWNISRSCAIPEPRTVSSRFRTIILKSIILVLCSATMFIAVIKIVPNITLFISSLDSSPLQQAFRFAKAHPQQAYFPHYPLATLYAETSVYHSAYGLWDRSKAKRPVEKELFDAYLPQNMSFVLFHKDSRWDKQEAVEPLLAKKGFTRKITLPGMSEWTVFTRPDYQFH